MKDEDLILALDIGNTTIHAGVLCNETVIADVKQGTRTEADNNFKEFLLQYGSRVTDIYICSVVPDVDSFWGQYLSTQIEKPIFFAGKDRIFPIENKYNIPSEVGQDRLANAFIAVYWGNSNSVIIDFGTAVTFDIVINKVYAGGLIFPGLNLSFKSLVKKAALLQEFNWMDMEKLSDFKIGKDTKTSVTLGLVYGYVSIIEGIIKRLKLCFNCDFSVLVTGGDFKFIKPFLSIECIYDPNLTLKAISLLSREDDIARK